MITRSGIRSTCKEVLEGEHDERPVVMFEFPNMEAIHAFRNSPDYVPIKKLREVRRERAPHLRWHWPTVNGDRGTKSKPVPEPHQVYGFLTTSPNAVVGPIHPPRR